MVHLIWLIFILLISQRSQWLNDTLVSFIDFYRKIKIIGSSSKNDYLIYANSKLIDNWDAIESRRSNNYNFFLKKSYLFLKPGLKSSDRSVSILARFVGAQFFIDVRLEYIEINNFKKRPWIPSFFSLLNIFCWSKDLKLFQTKLVFTYLGSIP